MQSNICFIGKKKNLGNLTNKRKKDRVGFYGAIVLKDHWIKSSKICILSQFQTNHQGL